MRISNKKLFIDWKYFSSGCHSHALNCDDMVNEFWKEVNILDKLSIEAGAFYITELYRKRWQIELFFKWIKQHLPGNLHTMLQISEVNIIALDKGFQNGESW